jgi:hypothetical protein
MIRRLAIGCVLTAALAIPAVASAEPSSSDVKNAAKDCRVQRSGMGADAFRQHYGTNKSKRNAFGKCVSKRARVEQRAAHTALNECKAEYLADPDAFLETYGAEQPAATTTVDGPRPGGDVPKGDTPEGDAPEGDAPEGDAPEGDAPEGDAPRAALRAAMHKCVELKLKALRADRREAVENAAKACDEERGDTDQSREAFREKYGSNKNGRNAFGKCVSQGVRKGVTPPSESEPESEPEPEPESDSPSD